MTLIVAGHETTASSLNWFWYLLTQSRRTSRAACMPKSTRRDRTRPPTAISTHCPFMRTAIDETLRLYPPGWLLTRRSIAADDRRRLSRCRRRPTCSSPPISSTGIRPTGRTRTGSIPTASSRRTAPARNRFVYLPFGLGPRACIGEHLALVEMHTHVATLARRFDLQLVPGQTIELEPQVNLRTRHPLRMMPRVRELNA